MNNILHPKYPIAANDFAHRYWDLGHSMEQIARDLGGWGGELRRHVLNAGLQLKTKRQAYDDRMKKGATRRYYYNQQFFDTWSPAMAWVLGLIASDGCLQRELRSWQITLADLECLHKAAATFGFDGPVYTVLHANCYVMKINSVIMGRSLLRLGITPAKSRTLEYPPMPIDMHRHFIRGYFDGDGSITTQAPRGKTGLVTIRASLCTGSKIFANALMARLEAAGMVPRFLTNSSGRHGFKHALKTPPKEQYQVRIGGYSAARLYEYLYEDVPNSLSMERKCVKYTAWYEAYGHMYANGPIAKGWNAPHVCQRPLFSHPVTIAPTAESVGKAKTTPQLPVTSVGSNPTPPA